MEKLFILEDTYSDSPDSFQDRLRGAGDSTLQSPNNPEDSPLETLKKWG